MQNRLATANVLLVHETHLYIYKLVETQKYRITSQYASAPSSIPKAVMFTIHHTLLLYIKEHTYYIVWDNEEPTHRE